MANGFPGFDAILSAIKSGAAQIIPYGSGEDAGQALRLGNSVYPMTNDWALIPVYTTQQRPWVDEMGQTHWDSYNVPSGNYRVRARNNNNVFDEIVVGGDSSGNLNAYNSTVYQTGSNSGGFFGSTPLGGMMNDLVSMVKENPVLPIVINAVVPGAGAVIQAVNAIDQGNTAAAIAALSNIPGASDVASPAVVDAIKTATQTATLVNALSTGNTLAAINSVAALTGSKGTEIGDTSVTVGDALKLANIANAIDSGNIKGVINGIQSLGTSSGAKDSSASEWDGTVVSVNDAADLLDNVMGLEAGPTQPQSEADLLDNVMGLEAQPTQLTQAQAAEEVRVKAQAEADRQAAIAKEHADAEERAKAEELRRLAQEEADRQAQAQAQAERQAQAQAQVKSVEDYQLRQKDADARAENWPDYATKQQYGGNLESYKAALTQAAIDAGFPSLAISNMYGGNLSAYAQDMADIRAAQALEKAQMEADAQAEAERQAAASLEQSAPTTNTGTVIDHDPETGITTVVDNSGNITTISTDTNPTVGDVVDIPATSTPTPTPELEAPEGGTLPETVVTAPPIADDQPSDDGTTGGIQDIIDQTTEPQYPEGGTLPETVVTAPTIEELTGGEGSLGEESDLPSDIQGGSLGDESDLPPAEEPQCAPGYHWNGSICVADTDVEDTSTTCPEGYLFDLATQTCVPISTNVDVTKPTTPITNPTGPTIPKNPTIPSTPINQNIQKQNFDLAALLSILGAASAQPQQAPAQEQQRYMQEMDFEGPLDVNFFSPAKKNVAGQNQQQTTKIATGGYIDDLLKILRG